MNLVQTMAETVFPVFVLAGLGWIARTLLNTNVQEAAKLSIYILGPGLIVNSIMGSRLVAGEVAKIVLFGLLITASLAALTLGLGRLMGWTDGQRSAAVLATAFMNAANYGLPVVLFTFGEAGFERAAIFVVVESFMFYSAGVYFAARGRLGLRDAAVAVFKLPLLWATAGALLVRLSGISVPEAVLKPLGLLADGAVVMVLIILGMQVASIRLRGARIKIGLAALIRLFVSPTLALGLVTLLRPDPLTARVLVLQAAMPSAVTMTMLAVKFNAEPDLVSGVTLVSTVASLGSVSLWVWLLQA